MKFGDKLYQLRRKKGISQEELGEQLNVTRQTVSKWELGQSKPDTDKLIEISKLFNVSLEILTNDEVVLEKEENTHNIDTTKQTTTSTETKPRRWLLVLLVILAIILAVILATKVVTDIKENSKNKKGFFDFFNVFDIFNTFQNSPEIFNKTFEMSSGTKDGMFVSDLIDQVITNNKKKSDHLILVVYKDISTKDTEEIRSLKTNFKTFTDYEVSFDYDKEGYINKVTIMDIEGQDTPSINTNDVGKSIFNNSFEMATGTSYGLQVSNLLDDVITSNNKNKTHLITVSYGSTITSDASELRELKKSFDSWTQYEVFLDYDENGYVNQVNIENY